MARSRFPARRCPVCGGGGSRLLYRQSFQRFSQIQPLDGYDVVICEDCGAGYADDIPPQATFDDYYRELSKYDYSDRGGKEPPGTQQKFDAIADVLERFILSRNSRILEIGSASGKMLRVLKDRGFPNVLGWDPSPGCARAAKELYDIPSVAATVFTEPGSEEPYDFLILMGVMEHIRDLDRAVHQFHRLVNASGRVYLEVPDASRYLAGLDAPFQEFSTEHINFFSALSLTNLMQARGFRSVASGHAVRPLYEIVCPTVYGVYEKSSQQIPFERDTETEPGLRAYIQGCQAEDDRIREKIERAVPAAAKMIVWGVGTHTLRLLGTGGLDPAKVALFVDSSAKYQEQKLQGIRVVSPGELAGRGEPILISSRGFQREIHDQIRELKLPNPVILLYDGADFLKPELLKQI
jgi:SAM-dependent methyltransferase